MKLNTDVKMTFNLKGKVREINTVTKSTAARTTAQRPNSGPATVSQ
jgi:hypothetical protein